MNNNIDIFKKITIKKQVYVDREPEKSNKVNKLASFLHYI